MAGTKATQTVKQTQALCAACLAPSPAGMQRQTVGYHIIQAVSKKHPDLASVLTNEIREMDVSEIRPLLGAEHRLDKDIHRLLPKQVWPEPQRA